MTSDTALRPFNPELKTIHVADAGPEGIALSVFQEQDNGCWVPVDYKSWHPLSLTSYSQQQLADMVIYYSDELCISKIVTDDLPSLITMTIVKQATNQDHQLQKLISCIKKGHLTNDPDLKEYCSYYKSSSTSKG